MGTTLLEEELLDGQIAVTKACVDAASNILDVNGDAVIAAFRDAGVTRMIHGHTHRPARHFLDVDGRTVERIVLGDWGPKCPVSLVDENGVTRVDATQLI